MQRAGLNEWILTGIGSHKDNRVPLFSCTSVYLPPFQKARMVDLIIATNLVECGWYRPHGSESWTCCESVDPRTSWDRFQQLADHFNHPPEALFNRSFAILSVPYAPPFHYTKFLISKPSASIDDHPTSGRTCCPAELNYRP